MIDLLLAIGSNASYVLVVLGAMLFAPYFNAYN